MSVFVDQGSLAFFPISRGCCNTGTSSFCCLFGSFGVSSRVYVQYESGCCTVIAIHSRFRRWNYRTFFMHVTAHDFRTRSSVVLLTCSSYFVFIRLCTLLLAIPYCVRSLRTTSESIKDFITKPLLLHLY